MSFLVRTYFKNIEKEFDDISVKLVKLETLGEFIGKDQLLIEYGGLSNPQNTQTYWPIIDTINEYFMPVNPPDAIKLVDFKSSCYKNKRNMNKCRKNKTLLNKGSEKLLLKNKKISIKTHDSISVSSFCTRQSNIIVNQRAIRINSLDETSSGLNCKEILHTSPKLN